MKTADLEWHCMFHNKVPFRWCRHMPWSQNWCTMDGQEPPRKIVIQRTELQIRCVQFPITIANSLKHRKAKPNKPLVLWKITHYHITLPARVYMLTICPPAVNSEDPWWPFRSRWHPTKVVWCLRFIKSSDLSEMQTVWHSKIIILKLEERDCVQRNKRLGVTIMIYYGVQLCHYYLPDLWGFAF